MPTRLLALLPLLASLGCVRAIHHDRLPKLLDEKEDLLQRSHNKGLAPCAAGDEAGCRAACDQGEARSCVLLANILYAKPDDPSVELPEIPVAKAEAFILYWAACSRNSIGNVCSAGRLSPKPDVACRDLILQGCRAGRGMVERKEYALGIYDPDHFSYAGCEAGILQDCRKTRNIFEACQLGDASACEAYQEEKRIEAEWAERERRAAAASAASRQAREDARDARILTGNTNLSEVEGRTNMGRYQYVFDFAECPKTGGESLAPVDLGWHGAESTCGKSLRAGYWVRYGNTYLVYGFNKYAQGCVALTDCQASRRCTEARTVGDVGACFAGCVEATRADCRL